MATIEQHADIDFKGSSIAINGTTTNSRVLGVDSSGDLEWVYMPRRQVATITGNGSSNTFTFTNALGTRDVVWEAYSVGASSTYSSYSSLSVYPTSSSVQVTFTSAPANGAEYKIIICG